MCHSEKPKLSTNIMGSKTLLQFSKTWISLSKSSNKMTQEKLKILSLILFVISVSNLPVQKVTLILIVAFAKVMHSVIKLIVNARKDSIAPVNVNAVM